MNELTEEQKFRMNLPDRKYCSECGGINGKTSRNFTLHDQRYTVCGGCISRIETKRSGF